MAAKKTKTKPKQAAPKKPSAVGGRGKQRKPAKK